MEQHGFHIDRWSDDDLFLYLAQYGLIENQSDMSRSDMETYAQSLLESSYGGTIDPNTTKASDDYDNNVIRPPSPPPPSIKNNKPKNNNNNNDKDNNDNKNKNAAIIDTAHEEAETEFCLFFPEATIENAKFYLGAHNYNFEAAINMYIEMPPDSLNSNTHDDPPEPPIRQPLAPVPRFNMHEERNRGRPIRVPERYFPAMDNEDYGIDGDDFQGHHPHHGYIGSRRVPKVDQFDAEGIRLPDDVVKRRLLSGNSRLIL